MQPVVCKFLNICEYQATLQAMQQFTKARNDQTIDEIWFLQHAPIFTLGQAGLDKHILNQGNIPVVRSDRGGQVTYHAPGQLMIYLLLDLMRKSLTIKDLIAILQQAIIDFLFTEYQLIAAIRPGAPGVYVGDKKICFIGLKVSRGCSYHGLSFNIDLNLQPFSQINPCGFEGLEVTQLSDLGVQLSNSAVVNQVAKLMQQTLCNKLGYRSAGQLYDGN